MSNKKASITGEVVEELKLNQKEWYSLKLEDGTIITINKKFCTDIETNNDKSHRSSKK